MDYRRKECVQFTSKSYSNRKSLSQSSPGNHKYHGQNASMPQSVHENLGSSLDARLADDCSPSGAKPNANNNWSRRKIIPTKEKQRLPTISGQKRFDGGECHSRLCRVEDAEVVADRLSKRRKFGKNSDTSFTFSKKENQRRTTTNNRIPAYQKDIDEAAKSRFSPLHNERQRSNLSRTRGVEVTKVVAERLPQRTKLEEKQMSRSTSPNQFQSQQPKRSVDCSLRYRPLFNEANELNKDRSCSRINISKKRYTGPFSRKTHEARMSMHNTVGDSGKERVKGPLVIPTRNYFNEEVSQQTHGARRPIHNTVRERYATEESLAIPSQNNVFEEVSRQIHKAIRSVHNTARERDQRWLKEESLVIPIRSHLNEEVSQQTHEASNPILSTVHERDKGHATEESLFIPTQVNVNEEFSQKSHKARRPMYNTSLSRDQKRVKEESLVIHTRHNLNEEASRYHIITPPIDGPNGNLVPVQPLVDPIWRGRFDIVNKEDYRFEGFVAHLSSSACQRVNEEAGLLPALLQLKMVPKSTMWPASFHSITPNDYHIALFFFPVDRRYEKIYDLLVAKMSEQELAMRTFTKNAELLIFSSIVLQESYRRFRNKLYIWGVFRGKI